MALTFLVSSVALQAWAVFLAVTIARRQNRSGFIFLAGASVLMFSRRAFSLYGALQLGRPGDPVAELMALLISLLLVVGLWALARHGAGAAPAATTQAPTVERLERAALALALIALVGTSSLIYLSYTASRDALHAHLNRSNLRLSRLLASVAATAQSNGRDPLVEIANAWASRRHDVGDAYLTVMAGDGRLLLDTNDPTQMGQLVGTTPLPAHASAAVDLAELARTQSDWVGRVVGGGGPELVAHTYDVTHGGLVSVHVPAAQLDAEVRSAAMPWALGFAATLMLILPMSLGLLFRASLAAQAALARAAAEQRQIEDRYRKIVETTHDGVWLIDAQNDTMFVNQRLATLLHTSVDDMLGKSIFEFTHPTVRDQVKAGIERRRQGIAEVYETRFLRSDGSELLASLSSSPVIDESGVYRGALAMVTDVTERRALEDKVRQTQKMEAIGQLAGGVAHDFNNLLTVIQGNAALLREEARAPETEELDEILRAAGRAAELTRQLLTFGRKQALHPQSLDINPSVRNVLQMLERTLGEHITVKTELGADLPSIHADSGMLEQVIVNLAVNARDAMPAGGELRVATLSQTLDGTRAAAMPEGRAGRFTCLSVGDTGTGIEPRHLAQIFEPFFTTKEVGKGTGLGLATVYAIAKQHDGWVTVETTLGQGSTFRVWFPASEKAQVVSDPPAPHSSAIVSRGRELILVVEDDPSVRPLVERVLRECGYRVLLAESAIEALDVWVEHRDEIQLLLTDLVMPGGITGQELADHLWLERPELEVLFTSGYSAELPKLHGRHAERGHFLAKPYLPKDLARAVRQRIARQSTRSKTPAA